MDMPAPLVDGLRRLSGLRMIDRRLPFLEHLALVNERTRLRDAATQLVSPRVCCVDGWFHRRPLEKSVDERSADA